MTDIALLPCPHCSGKAELHTNQIAEDAVEAFVMCSACFATTDNFEDAYAPTADAIAAWNRRASPSQVAPANPAQVTDALTAAVVALARHGIEPDVQSLLISGSPSRGIRPGALNAVITALSQPHPADERVVEALEAAEIAQLRALPLKDEVERVLEPFADKNVLEAYEDGSWVDCAFTARQLRDAQTLLSRLRAGVQEGWRTIGYARAIDVDSAERPFEGKTAFWVSERQTPYYSVPVYLPAAPSEQGGDRDANR